MGQGGRRRRADKFPSEPQPLKEFVPGTCQMWNSRAGLTIWGWQQRSQSNANWGTELLWQEVFRLLNTFLGLGVPTAPKAQGSRAHHHCQVYTKCGSHLQFFQGSRTLHMHVCKCRHQLHTDIYLHRKYFYSICIQAIVELKESSTTGKKIFFKNLSCSLHCRTNCQKQRPCSGQLPLVTLIHTCYVKAANIRREAYLLCHLEPWHKCEKG